MSTLLTLDVIGFLIAFLSFAVCSVLLGPSIAISHALCLSLYLGIVLVGLRVNTSNITQYSCFHYMNKHIYVPPVPQGLWSLCNV